MIRRRFVAPLLDLSRQGITPEKTALTIALGLALGIIPVLGFTTLLCTAAAVVLKLNLPVIQLVNWLVYPAQLALLVPFLKMGACLFGDQAPAMTVGGLFEFIRSDAWHAIATLRIAATHALAAWAVCSCALVALLYLMLVPLLRRLWARGAGAE